VPNMMGYVERPQHIRVDYIDSSGQPQSMELKGFLATVFQHEFDHLDGLLYVDRLKDTRLFSFDTEYTTYHLPKTNN
ncbi:MAG: peptide deformylase, partial [Candidatus Azotimanducaceae bacterium]